MEIAREAGLIVFCHGANRGYGANQKTCFTQTLAMGADVIVMVHPDHQYNATVIPALIQPIYEGKADAVFGSRMLGGKTLEGGMPWWKYDANIFLTSLANIVFQRYLSEIHSGFRAYSRKYLETVRFEQNSDDLFSIPKLLLRVWQTVSSLRKYPLSPAISPKPRPSIWPEASNMVLGSCGLYFALTCIARKFGAIRFTLPKARNRTHRIFTFIWGLKSLSGQLKIKSAA